MRDQTDVQRAARLVGLTFLAVGIAGFIPGLTTNLYDGLEFAGHEGIAGLLGIFEVSVLHNFVHLGFGLAGLALAATVERRERSSSIADAPEGRILTRTHRVRERNRRLVQRKKDQALQANGTLVCEVCGFDYRVKHGERGDGFIECHHTVPVSDLAPDDRRTASIARRVAAPAGARG